MFQTAALVLSLLGLPAPADDPTPARVLMAADEAFGEARSVSYHLIVEPIGATALDQSRLDLDILAIQLQGTWQFLITGQATLPDGVTRRPVAVSVGEDGVRAVDPEGQRVVEAAEDAAATLLAEQGVFPSIFWVAMWDGLISKQLEDAGSGLPMKSAGPRLVGDRPCNAVRVDYTRQRRDLGGVYDVWWFIDAATNLPARIEVCYFRKDQNAYGFNILSISDLVIDPEISDSAMTLAIPPGYAVEPYALPDMGGGDMAGPSLGSVAPDWTLKDVAGVEHRLRDYRGSIVVMDFWATWCGPCRAAMPGLQALHEEFAGKPVHILGINVWESDDPVAYMRSEGFTYGLMVEADAVGEAYSVDGIPAIFAVGPDGKVIFRAAGYSPDLEANLRAAIQRALPATTPIAPIAAPEAPATPTAGG